ncbi:Porin D precursor [compost metagenome]
MIKPFAPLGVLISLACFQANADAETNRTPDFFSDTKMSATLRNFYFNRDFRHGHSSATGTNAFKPAALRSGRSEEWAQGIMTNLASGFTPGVIGVGFDAYGFLGIRLDSGGGRAGLRLMPLDGEGHPQTDYLKTGAAIKLKYEGAVLQYGNLFPNVPVLAVNTARLFPSSATGWMLGWDQGNVHVDAGHFYAQGGVDSTNNDDRLTLDYGLPTRLKTINYAGIRYSPSPELKISGYASELVDVWQQYYGGMSYRLPLSAKSTLTLDGNLYRTTDTGQALADSIRNTTWSLAVGYRYLAHSLTFAYQKVDSDEPMDWVGFGTQGGGVMLANAVQYSTFTEANERSLQLRYDLDFAPLGVPGLSLTTRYIRGDQISNSDSDNRFYTKRYVYPEGSNPRHWERDVEVRYVVQSGPARNLAVRLRQATHRASTGYRHVDIDEVRVILDYPLSIL